MVQIGNYVFNFYFNVNFPLTTAPDALITGALFKDDVKLVAATYLWKLENPDKDPLDFHAYNHFVDVEYQENYQFAPQFYLKPLEGSTPIFVDSNGNTYYIHKKTLLAITTNGDPGIAKFISVFYPIIGEAITKCEITENSFLEYLEKEERALNGVMPFFGLFGGHYNTYLNNINNELKNIITDERILEGAALKLFFRTPSFVHNMYTLKTIDIYISYYHRIIVRPDDLSNRLKRAHDTTILPIIRHSSLNFNRFAGQYELLNTYFDIYKRPNQKKSAVILFKIPEHILSKEVLQQIEENEKKLNIQARLNYRITQQIRKYDSFMWRQYYLYKAMNIPYRIIRFPFLCLDSCVNDANFGLMSCKIDENAIVKDRVNLKLFHKFLKIETFALNNKSQNEDKVIVACSFFNKKEDMFDSQSKDETFYDLTLIVPTVAIIGSTAAFLYFFS